MMDISWKKFEDKFEYIDETLRYQFEVMCRRLFKRDFPDVEYWPSPRLNNPGLEMPPAYDPETEKMVGFQAKYFSGDGKAGSEQYEQIFKSLKKAIEEYVIKSGEERKPQVSVIYLYCNKRLDEKNKKLFL